MSESVVTLQSLPDDILYIIFKNCDTRTLFNLELTCRNFHRIINETDLIWRQRSHNALGSNMVAPAMIERCRPSMSVRQRCLIGLKWENKQCHPNIVTRFPGFMPWLTLDKEVLLCSAGNIINKYARDHKGNVSKYRQNRVSESLADITKFVLNGDVVVFGQSDGTLSVCERHDLVPTSSFEAHTDVISSIDAKDDILVTGSKDRCVKIWSYLKSEQPLLVKEIRMNIRILSVALFQSQRSIIIGLPGTNQIHPIQIYDVISGQFISNVGRNFRYGAGIIDIFRENDYNFFTSSYDTTVKLWDIRTPQTYVSSWMDPFDAALYCTKSDHNMTVLSGSNYGIIHVWDKRMPRWKQELTCERFNGPVFGLEFDASHVFAAFDRGLVQYKF